VLYWCFGFRELVSDSLPDSDITVQPTPYDWRAVAPPPRYFAPVPRHPPLKTLFLACFLFALTLITCLVAGAHFAAAYAQNRAVSWDEFVRALTLIYRHPIGLASGIPFAITLLAILLTHELGHFFTCRHHGIHSSYPFFIPFPTLIGTLGAFILIRSPIRTTRALFDVGASGPLVGFVVAVPALIFGVLHAKFVPGLADSASADIILGTPLILRLVAGAIHPGVPVNGLLLDPVGRAAWVGLFATSLNLLPAAQLDGGHILRSLSPRAHRYFSIGVPICLMLLGFFHFWAGWYVWGALLLVIRFFRFIPVFDPVPLDVPRRFGAALTLLVFILCFMPAPFVGA
jgi:membrane-associated protease RseP (regulator of RpoE activity)